MAYCWGRNFHGQVGDGTAEQRLRPTAVHAGVLFAGVSPGGDHTCGVTAGGAAYCWGANSLGQVGDGTAGSDRLTPVPVAGGLQFGPINAGLAHTCAVTTEHQAYCWGNNNQGELGDGNRGTSHATPVAVAGAM